MYCATIDEKDKEIHFLRDRIYQLETRIKIFQKQYLTTSNKSDISHIPVSLSFFSSKGIFDSQLKFNFPPIPTQNLYINYPRIPTQDPNFD